MSSEAETSILYAVADYILAWQQAGFRPANLSTVESVKCIADRALGVALTSQESETLLGVCKEWLDESLVDAGETDSARWLRIVETPLKKLR